ncbi:MAG: alpha/beta hydrolase [Pseudomonadales bacterium]|nr:alpha/beta hydrolase [Pseudomonadales bacterium]MCP5302561.1 alpha/beta hydrolase [Pseudomonadales bacterium]
MAILSLAQLEDVSSNLRHLAFDPATDTVEKTASELAYLNYYGLDLSESFPGTRHYLGSMATGHFRIACQYWLPANLNSSLESGLQQAEIQKSGIKGTVFITHGYFDHVGIYGYLIRYLLQQRYAVVAFDLPGHGNSSGERVTIETFDHYVEVFAELLRRCEPHLPRPWKAVGQSTGGAILLKFLMAARPERYENPLESVTLLAPLIHPTAWRVNLWVYRLIHRVVKNLRRKFMANTSDPVFNQFVATRDPLQDRHIPLEWVGAMKHWTEEFADLPVCDFPVKIIQGDKDTTVDWQYNLKAIKGKLPNAKIMMVSGAGHHLVNESVSLRKQIFENIDV